MAKIKMKVSVIVVDTFHDFLMAKKSMGLSEKTIITYSQHFSAIAKHLQVDKPIDELNKEDIESILSIISAGEKIVVECHTGPQNGVYCIFDTVNKSFDADVTGNHLIWYDDDISTAIYSFWSDIYSYDGNIIKSYDLTEDERIYDLAFSDDHAQLIATIVRDDGAERVDVIDL